MTTLKSRTGRNYARTDSETAIRYAKANWSGKGSRESYLSSIRYKGKFELPKDSACLQQPNERQ